MLVMVQDVKRQPTLRGAMELTRSQLSIMGEDSLYPDQYKPKAGEFVPTQENLWNAGFTDAFGAGGKLAPLLPGETGGVHLHGFDPNWNQPPPPIITPVTAPPAYAPPGPPAYTPPAPPAYAPPAEQPEDNSELREILRMFSARSATPTTEAPPSGGSSTKMIAGVGAAGLVAFLVWRIVMR